ncbi:hypothetical protein G6F65_023507 [Rhizopus arrhizus]|nr:hypothetical protein G6F65_023507 [Rhizopus arrhizus]
MRDQGVNAAACRAGRAAGRPAGLGLDRHSGQFAPVAGRATDCGPWGFPGPVAFAAAFAGRADSDWTLQVS